MSAVRSLYRDLTRFFTVACDFKRPTCTGHCTGHDVCFKITVALRSLYRSLYRSRCLLSGRCTGMLNVSPQEILTVARDFNRLYTTVFSLVFSLVAVLGAMRCLCLELQWMCTKVLT